MYLLHSSEGFRHCSSFLTQIGLITCVCVFGGKMNEKFESEFEWVDSLQGSEMIVRRKSIYSN